MLGLFLDAFVLIILVSVLAKRQSSDFSHYFLVSFGIAVLNFIIIILSANANLGLLVLPILAFIDGLIIMKYCWLHFTKAMLIAGIFLAYRVGFEVLVVGALNS